jgi:hypothetical protein
MRILGTKRIALSLLIAFALINTACPKVSQSALDKAASASRTVSVRYVETVDFVTSLYKGGAIKLDTKDKIADALETFGKNGKKFNDLLATYSAQYANGQVPANVWSAIAKNFDELSADFLSVLKLLPQAAGLADTKAFRAISAAVLSLAQILSENSIIPNLKYQDLQREARTYGLV